MNRHREPALGALILGRRLDGHGFSGLRLRTARERDATRSPTAMRGNCSTEDEPGYRQLLHGSSEINRE